MLLVPTTCFVDNNFKTSKNILFKKNIFFRGIIQGESLVGKAVTNTT